MTVLNESATLVCNNYQSVVNPVLYCKQADELRVQIIDRIRSNGELLPDKISIIANLYQQCIDARSNHSEYQYAIMLLYCQIISAFIDYKTKSVTIVVNEIRSLLNYLFIAKQHCLAVSQSDSSRTKDILYFLQTQRRVINVISHSSYRSCLNDELKGLIASSRKALDFLAQRCATLMTSSATFNKQEIAKVEYEHCAFLIEEYRDLGKRNNNLRHQFLKDALKSIVNCIAFDSTHETIKTNSTSVFLSASATGACEAVLKLYRLGYVMSQLYSFTNNVKHALVAEEALELSLELNHELTDKTYSKAYLINTLANIKRAIGKYKESDILLRTFIKRSNHVPFYLLKTLVYQSNSLILQKELTDIQKVLMIAKKTNLFDVKPDEFPNIYQYACAV